ncbi:flagella basal body P-ring formation protein FlgA [uncultured Sphingomonas sp.]|uniref:flagella basal body P-ring formation protein FlgA n=1 Tax=uncultured Sphingomonas sp. TaxID=158754 RepID=UPI0035CB7521
MFRAASLLLFAAPASATGFQSTVALDRAVAGFTMHAVGEEGGARMPVDPRLKLALCPTVALSWRTPAQDAVVVACSGPDWRIFVPVKRSAPSAGAAPSSAVARATPAIRAEPVIRRGDPVIIQAGSPGFSIAREGVAMADAAPGTRFLVRVADARAPVQAVAVEPGRATLPGWSN